MSERSLYHQDALPIADQMVTVPTEPVVFPYDGNPIGTAPVGSPELAGRALDHAVQLRPAVRRLPAHARRSFLPGVHAELRPTATPMGCRSHRPVSPSPAALRSGTVSPCIRDHRIQLPAAHKLAPAIAAGCPVIAKPAPQAPLAVLALATMFRAALREVGAPPGAVQVVTGGAEVGATLVADRRIGAVSFTGSATVGHRIARAAAPTKVLLELGSNSALIVAADAELGAAAVAVAQGGFYASGQACISVQRVLVERQVAQAFLEALLPQVAALRARDPRLASTQVSALIDPAATQRVLNWVSHAEQAGATTLLGGTATNGVLAPTVLLDVPDEVHAWDEKIFGPVVCVRIVADFDEAVATTNRSRYGLHASVFTSGLHTTLRAIYDLDVGGVVINAVPGFRADNMPYGGVKDSGLGREGPRCAIEELTVPRMAIINPLASERVPS